MPTTKLTKSRIRSEIKQLADVVEDAVDNGAKTVEEIHKAVADLPLHMLERFDALHAVAKDARKVQDESIGAIYDLIRKVNHEVAKLANELLARRAGYRHPQPKARKKAAGPATPARAPRAIA